VVVSIPSSGAGRCRRDCSTRRPSEPRFAVARQPPVAAPDLRGGYSWTVPAGSLLQGANGYGLELPYNEFDGHRSEAGLHALTTDPVEEGSLVLEVDVGPNGDVSQTRSAVRRGPSHDLAQCIEAVALAGRFSQPTTGSATLALQLTFELAK